jgi:uncharacterized protein YndB with AHSA1/START domain
MAIHLRASIVINRPIQEVWSYVVDEANSPVWRRPYSKQVTRVGAGPTAVGTRFQGVISSGTYVSEITHYEPPVRMSWRYVSYPAGSVKGREGSYLLASEGPSTRMTLDETSDAVGLLGPVLSFPLTVLLSAVIGPRLLKQLKAEVEGPTMA